MNEAEELHKESLEILARLASSSAEKLDDEKNVICNYKVSHSFKTLKACTACSQEKCSGACDKENMSPNIQCTPQKQRTSCDPVTPTANLKMLVCAASVLTPAGSEKEEEKRNLFRDTPLKEKNIQTDINIVPPDCCNQDVKGKRGQQLLGRKEKSLGLLCKRFLLIYPEYSESGTTIMLDDVVRELGIGRRRVYDIVNVLESMEMMVRQAKNKYLWYGKSRLADTLTKLKALALRVYGKNFSNISNRNPRKLLPKGLINNPLTVLTTAIEGREHNLEQTVDEQTLTQPCNDEDSQDDETEYDDMTASIMDYIISNESTRKENSRSLGILCQKFIMLFMVAENNIVTLDKAARILLNESEEGLGKYKTKVRRLYDIANILTSIQFLEKTNSYENASKKAAYKWVGLDLRTLDSEDGIKKAFRSLEVCVTRHSLLAQVPKLPSDLQTNGQRKFRCRSASAHQLNTANPGKFDDAFKAKFPRTYSAAAAVKEDTDDGFDIENLQEAIEDTNGDESPNQMRFKEKLRKLQAEFPDKLPNTGLIDLINATATTKPLPQIEDAFTVETPSQKPKPNLRRSLSGDFSSENPAPPSKKMRLNVPTHPNHPVALVQQQTLSALKPLLSYPETNQSSMKPNTLQISKACIVPNVTPTPSSDNVVSSAPKLPRCIPMEGKPVQGRPLILSSITNLSNPIALQKTNGVYQIIPLQCKGVKATTIDTSKPIHAVPIVLSQQTQNSIQAGLNTPSSNMVTMVMRQPIVTVATPNAHLSPRNQMLKKPTNEVLTSQQMMEKYPEYFTPPHTLLQPNGKPNANPIIFPKMAPETPSSDPKGALNAVTRKLMSLQNEESK